MRERGHEVAGPDLCVRPSLNTVHLSVAQAVKPAEPRFISAFFSFPGDSCPSATTNESWISCGVAFPTYGRKASACLSRGISTGACHTRSTRRQTNRMRDKPLSGWTDISTPRGGPLYLKQQPIAQLVVDSIHYGAQHLQYYDLEAFVVMANHVHLLVLPRVSPSRFLPTLKGYTAREANRLLERTGQPFWQAESYDHSVRDDRESDRIKGYIENNPVKAGLVANAEDYLWSSAARKAEMNLGSTGSTACATKLSEQSCH